MLLPYFLQLMSHFYNTNIPHKELLDTFKANALFNASF